MYHYSTNYNMYNNFDVDFDVEMEKLHIFYWSCNIIIISIATRGTAKIYLW